MTGTVDGAANGSGSGGGAREREEREERPVADIVEIKVERGHPTPEELAAVVALVQARAAASVPDEEAGPRRLNGWNTPARTVPRGIPRPGPGAWRMSVWPA
ncbi:acyl-CoA carboxylase subunit epsilon [Streptomyces sp. HPF1205]|uniref:acyl-CoA carboxylase subunit epsilon n=1 Tax=Streptomyces sp. HPF1205 TaxID=2873262 RepID=UPI001CEDD320|nr:acyl-CoA carboxylase subunit epsilon [Streptomyces sp. HPF1205]